MIVHYPQMTGDELNIIYKVSGLTQDEFAAVIGKDTRQQLITQINRRNKPIDEDVEKAINDNPELARHKLLVVSKQNEVVSNDRPGPVVELLLDTIQTFKEVLKKNERQTEVMEKAVNGLIASNDHIREEAVMYRRIIDDGYNNGLLQWVKPKK